MSQSESAVPVRSPFTARRKSVGSSSEWTRKSYLQSEDGPVVIAAVEDLDLMAWTQQNTSSLKDMIEKHGAVLLRGFAVKTVEAFRNFVLALSPNMLEYKERSSPRHKVQADIYTSTDYPAHQSIFFHNENSYQFIWPMKICFFCSLPAEHGGETPIADVRRVYRRLSPKTIQRFEEKCCMYVRNFDEALGLSWQEVFQTSDRLQVDEYCKDNGITCEWKENNGLRTRAIRPAVAVHPRTGERVWFNHVAFFHISTLDASIRDGLLAAMPEPDLPANSYYGDGSSVEEDVIEEIRSAYRSESVSFPWKKGDILAVDNMLTAHSRNPFVGERKILVGMAEPYSRRQDLEAL
jgi:alpha-ketoglutarate-dependent taurine dioxygenase